MLLGINKHFRRLDVERNHDVGDTEWMARGEYALNINEEIE